MLYLTLTSPYPLQGRQGFAQSIFADSKINSKVLLSTIFLDSALRPPSAALPE
jgi:hypothetical protein